MDFQFLIIWIALKIKSIVTEDDVTRVAEQNQHSTRIRCVSQLLGVGGRADTAHIEQSLNHFPHKVRIVQPP